jgi:two-component system, OmpR family, response regulator
MASFEPVLPRALIVDDEMDICYLLSSILKKRNFRASYCNTLKDARNILEKEVPNILFLDNYLPDGFGVDFIPYVKEHYPNTRIVMITAHDSVSERAKALNKGAELFLGKPLTVELIQNALEKVS